jgi:hypothetical protein
MARASVNNVMRSQLADIANLLLDAGGGTVTTGTANAYLLNLPTAPTAYADNLAFICKLHAAVTGPSTININGIGVKPLKKLVDGAAVPLVVNDGPAGHRAVCIYSTSDNCVLMLQALPSFTNTGGETWPITDRMREQIYLLDYIPQSEHAAIRDCTSTFDCADAFEAAMAAITVPQVPGDPAAYFYNGGPEIIFPYGKCHFSRTLEIKKTMILTGQGGGHRQFSSSTLEFAADITGITVNSLTGFEGSLDPPSIPVATGGSKGGDATIIRNLHIKSLSNGVPNLALNTTGSGVGHGIGHGIWVRAQCLIEHCLVQYFPQHGIYIRAIAGAPNTAAGWAIYGNANLTQVYHVASLSNGGCGVYIDGPDTNGCLLYGMDIANNRLSGVFESSQTGSTHIQHHTDINGMDALCSFSEDAITSYRYYCRDAFRANNNAPAWTPSTAYIATNGQGVAVRNAGNIYKLLVAGTSAAAGGPTTTAAVIADGSAVWSYVSADAGIRIPPAGHAQSADVWARVFPTLSQANPDLHPFYPIWPSGPGAVIPHLYRLGYNFWFDSVSARPVLINPYIEVNQPYSLMRAPAIVIGGLQYDAASDNIFLTSSTTQAIMGPGIQVASRTGSARAFTSYISRSADEAQAWITDNDWPGGLAFKWNEASGCWVYIHSGTNAPLYFTSYVNTLTAGRSAALAKGNALFPTGLWVGSSQANLRHFSMAAVQPTTGQYAAGDYVMNAAPTGVGSILGWRCITTGDFAGTPPVFQVIQPTTSQQTLTPTTTFALVPLTTPRETLISSATAATRAYTLSTTGAYAGLRFRITNASAFAMTNALKSIGTLTWAEFVFDGTAWYLGAAGAL